MQENGQARLDGLRAALSVLGVTALVALFFAYGIPTRPVGETSAHADTV